MDPPTRIRRGSRPGKTTRGRTTVYKVGLEKLGDGPEPVTSVPHRPKYVPGAHSLTARAVGTVASRFFLTGPSHPYPTRKTWEGGVLPFSVSSVRRSPTVKTTNMGGATDVLGRGRHPPRCKVFDHYYVDPPRGTGRSRFEGNCPTLSFPVFSSPLKGFQVQFPPIWKVSEVSK